MSVQTQPVSPKEASQLFAATEAIAKLIDELNDGLEGLEAKLSPVLAPDGPHPVVDGPPKDTVALSPHVSRLRGFEERVGTMIGHVQALTGRLET